MHQTHDAFAPASPTQPQSLAPNPLLLSLDPLQFLLLLFPPALLKLVVSGHTLPFSDLVHKLLAVFLERRHGIQTEFVVRSDKVCRPRYNHRRDRLIALQKLFHVGVGDGD